MPCDCVCFGVGVVAVLTTAGACLLTFLAPLEAVPLGGTQSEVCRLASSCDVTAGCADVAGLWFRSNVEGCNGDVFRISFVAATLAPALNHVTGLYIAAATSCWILICSGAWRHFHGDVPDVAETQEEGSRSTSVDTAASTDALVRKAAPDIPTVSMFGTQPFRLGSSPLASAALRAWPLLALFLLCNSSAALLPAFQMLSFWKLNSHGKLRAYFESVEVKLLASSLPLLVVACFPLLRVCALAAMWTVGGIPWALYRYAGDRRVMRRVVRSGRRVENCTEIPCCIALDMCCCSCLDGPVTLPAAMQVKDPPQQPPMGIPPEPETALPTANASPIVGGPVTSSSGAFSDAGENVGESKAEKKARREQRRIERDLEKTKKDIEKKEKKARKKATEASIDVGGSQSETSHAEKKERRRHKRTASATSTDGGLRGVASEDGDNCVATSIDFNASRVPIDVQPADNDPSTLPQRP